MADSSLNALIEALRRLPGVGAKSASRMAFHLLQHDRAGAQVLAQALQQAATQVRHCTLCHTFTENEVCATCLDAPASALVPAPWGGEMGLCQACQQRQAEPRNAET